ncbi:hypothetical protein Purlil1_4790 [Purpureocillium lilacinum]|uniref:AT hook domain-containing protein n=1 Tax=Purpureocillium lilacinum TaxID=33203 RepID=A0ABR0C3E3_PURLI|nr:hypothetical protein Purlil1_4790 [Purpureocillium lilacinum]
MAAVTSLPEVIDLTLDSDDDSDENTKPASVLTPTSIVFNPHPPPLSQPIQRLPPSVGPSLTKLSRADHRTLVEKRTWLQTHKVAVPSIWRAAPSSSRASRHKATPCNDTVASTNSSSSSIATGTPVDATLVFAQQEAGTAVCLSPRGLLLTCAHCIADSPDDLSFARTHWLLFPSGALVAAVALAWDPRRDLALLLVTRCSASPSRALVVPEQLPFPHVRVAPSAPRPGASLVCIGHPAAEDLEHPVAGTQTGYDVLVVSTGSYRGLAPGPSPNPNPDPDQDLGSHPGQYQDPQDNADIGALMHDCWTYWGHSGAPLVERRAAGALVGLHSSWDDETAMRRGVPWEAVTAFLGECGERFGAQAAGDWPWFVK